MLRKFIASQFKRPTGMVGIWVSNIMMKGNEKNYNKLIKDLNLQAHDKLLEIGYGPGWGIHTIAEVCPTCTVHGIDFSPLMFKRASKYNEAEIQKGNVLLYRADFLNIPLANANYDKVFCLNVIYFWHELSEPFAKIFSVLKNGGSFHIYMADRDMLAKKKAPDSVFHKYSMEQVVDALKAAGFTSINHYTEKGHYIKATK